MPAQSLPGRRGTASGDCAPSPTAASQVCDLTGKKRNKANTVSFSGKRNRKWQGANIQEKRIYWPEGQRLVRLKVRHLGRPAAAAGTP